MTILNNENKSHLYRWYILAACFISLFFWGVNYSSYTALLGIIKKDLNLSFTESGLIGASFFAGYAVGQIPWGYFADKLGSKKAIVIGNFGLAVFSILFGTSKSIVDIVIWRSIAGFLSAGIFSPSVKIISEAFDKNEHPLILGIFTASINIGFLISPVSSVFIETQFNWRTSILFFAFMSLALTPLIWFWLRKTPPSNKMNWGLKDLKIIFREPIFGGLSYDHVMRFGLIFILISWIPFYLSYNFNFSITLAALLVAVMNGIAVFSSLLGGLISKRIGEIQLITYL